MDEPSAAKRPSVLTIDRAAFLLLRVKRAFKKKRQQRKEKHENNTTTSIGPTIAKAILDPQRRNVLVDEAFLEQKDILLDMLEAKLKEVRDKKKKKADHVENSNVVLEPIKCDILPNNVDLNLKGNGIIAVGETDVQLKFGETGNSTLKLNATGISNIGNAYLNLEIGDGTLNIPNLNKMISGSLLKNPCEKQKKIADEVKSDNDKDILEESQFRRSLVVNSSAISEIPNNLLKNTVPNNNGSNVTDELTTSTLSNTDTTQDIGYVNE